MKLLCINFIKYINKFLVRKTRSFSNSECSFWNNGLVKLVYDIEGVASHLPYIYVRFRFNDCRKKNSTVFLCGWFATEHHWTIELIKENRKKVKNGNQNLERKTRNQKLEHRQKILEGIERYILSKIPETKYFTT